MADPRQTGPGVGQRDTSLRAQMLKAKGEQKNLNLCPCGCVDQDLNDHGYCDHLIGFTSDGKTVELREFDVPSLAFDDPEKPEGRKLPWTIEERVGTKTEPCKPSDILVWITSTARVYRGARVAPPVDEDSPDALKKRVEYLELQLGLVPGRSGLEHNQLVGAALASEDAIQQKQKVAG